MLEVDAASVSADNYECGVYTTYRFTVDFNSDPLQQWDLIIFEFVNNPFDISSLTIGNPQFSKFITYSFSPYLCVQYLDITPFDSGVIEINNVFNPSVIFIYIYIYMI